MKYVPLWGPDPISNPPRPPKKEGWGGITKGIKTGGIILAALALSGCQLVVGIIPLV